MTAQGQSLFIVSEDRFFRIAVVRRFIRLRLGKEVKNHLVPVFIQSVKYTSYTSYYVKKDPVSVVPLAIIFCA